MTRDPKRIDAILAQLAELWKRHPDMRLGQVVANLTRDPRSRAVSGAHTFNLEDDDMLREIELAIATWGT